MSIPHQPRARHFGDGGITVGECGEEFLLDHLVEIARAASPRSTALLADDAAIWSPPAGQDVSMSVDVIVEHEDFERAWVTPGQLGRRAFNVAASDMAAMGALPTQCVVSLCARSTEQLGDLLEVQRGLCAAAAALSCTVVGGDVSATSGPLTIDVCVVGTLPAGLALRRDAGRWGDLLVVTGSLGRAAAGLRLLAAGALPASDSERDWRTAQLEASQRIAEGRRLLELGVRCAGDLSDGLIVDARRTARSSGCGAELWADHLPVDPALRIRFSHEWLELATAGGEDFELLAAVPELAAHALLSAWHADLAPLTVVGRLTEGAGLRLLGSPGGAELPLPPIASRHFS